MDKKLKALALGGIVVVSALAGGAIHSLTAEPVVIEKLVPVEKIVTVEKLVNVTKEVKVEVPVEKIVTVEDTTFKALACDRLHYELVADCVQEVKAEDAALKIAIEAIKSDFASELEDADIVSKEKYADLVKIYNKFEDLTVEESNYDNSEYSFVIKAKINDNHEDERKYVNFTVDVNDGEATITDVELI